MLPLCGVPNGFDANRLRNVVVLRSHNCDILSRKGCDISFKLQEKSVKNKKF